MSDVKNQVQEILSAVIAAKQQALKPLRKMSDDLSGEGSSKEDARAFIQAIRNNENHLSRDDVKALISSVAVAHKIYTGIGDYGHGEFIVLDQYGADSYGVNIGDWISSSESC